MYFSEKRLVIKINKAKLAINKPMYLGLLILDITRIAMRECWYDQAKLKCGNQAIVHIKTEDVYDDLGGDVQKRFDTSNYELEKSQPIQNKRLMKDELIARVCHFWNNDIQLSERRRQRLQKMCNETQKYL